MRIEKSRHLAILSTLIKSRDTYCSSDFLAEKAMASVRTIKTDISYLNQLLKEDGSAYIESIKSKGYKLIPTNDQKFDALCDTIKVYRVLFRVQSIEKASRVLFIIQTLLAKETIRIDDIADSLFVSRSALTEEMTWVRNFIQSFHLELHSVPGKGLMVKGTERDIRSAMLEVICSQYHDIDFIYPVDSFENWFHTEWYEDIRHEILKVIRESEISITDIGGKQLATYFCLCEERNAAGCTLSFSEEEADELKKMVEYSIAEKLFELPSVKANITLYEDEILNVSRMLRLIRDVNLRKETDKNTLDHEIIEQSYRIFDTFRDSMKKRHSLPLFQTDYFYHTRDDFASVLVRVLHQYKYDYLGKMRMITYTEMEETIYSPLALEFTRIFVEYVQEILGSMIAVSDVRALSGIFHHLLNRLPINYRKQRLAVFSMEGITVAEMIKQELLCLYSPYIEKADVFNLYEMRRIDFADYDAVIASWNVAYYVYPIPLIVYTGSDHRNDRHRLFHSLFLKGYSFEPLHVLQKNAQVYRNTPIETYMDLIRSLGKRFGKDATHEKLIVSQAVNRFNSISYYNPFSGISMIFLDYEDTDMELFEIYEPEKTVFWGNSLEIRYFVVISLKDGNNLSHARIFHEFLAHVSNSRKNVRAIMSDIDQGMEKIYIEVLKNLFY